MAGSIRAFEYETDNGQKFGVRQDESASEATLNGVMLMDNYVSGTPQLPCGVKKRYVNTVLSTDPTITKRFVIGDALQFNTSAVAGTSIVEAAGGLSAGGTWNITSKVGERQTFLRSNDTGQIDGDNP
jgi:hypothetical protein